MVVRVSTTVVFIVGWRGVVVVMGRSLAVLLMVVVWMVSEQAVKQLMKTVGQSNVNPTEWEALRLAIREKV